MIKSAMMLTIRQFLEIRHENDDTVGTEISRMSWYKYSGDFICLEANQLLKCCMFCGGRGGGVGLVVSTVALDLWGGWGFDSSLWSFHVLTMLQGFLQSKHMHCRQIVHKVVWVCLLMVWYPILHCAPCIMGQTPGFMRPLDYCYRRCWFSSQLTLHYIYGIWQMLLSTATYILSNFI